LEPRRILDRRAIALVGIDLPGFALFRPDGAREGGERAGNQRAAGDHGGGGWRAGHDLITSLRSRFRFNDAGSYPPVTLMGRATAGARARRSMMKSWPFGLRRIAASIAAWRSSSLCEARSGLRRSAASSWPRHI